MCFNFDEDIDRRHSDSLKWNTYTNKDIIPMWIADTDFKSPPCIIEALKKRINHGLFGYGIDYPPEFISIIIERMEIRYKWKIQQEWLIILPGVVSGLHLAVRTLTKLDQAVIIPCPIYPPFREAVYNAGRKYRLAPMRLFSERWCIDLTHNTHPKMTGEEGMLMLCNPHNPGGTSYRRKELEEYLSFSQKHNLLVCSDEIHCDLLLKKGIMHIPFASLNEDAENRSITLMSPSKTFNIAGLGASIAIIPNEKIRMKFIKNRVGMVPKADILAITAATAAWKAGQPWLDQQIDYLQQNYNHLFRRMREMKGLYFSGLEATYLAWIDASGLGVPDPQIFFEKEANVGLSSGTAFGDSRFVRLNFGCPIKLLDQALDRMMRACNKRNRSP